MAVHARNDYNRFREPAKLLAVTNRLLNYARDGIIPHPNTVDAYREVVDSYPPIAEGCTRIADDEPVILFRAQDRHFCAILRKFWELVNEDPDMSEEQKNAILSQLEHHNQRAFEWQKVNGKKSPDVPLEES